MVLLYHYSLDVIKFHPLSRVNVSTTRQPQRGCLHFHELCHVTTCVIVSQKQWRPNFLPCKKNKNLHTYERYNWEYNCCKLHYTYSVFLILSLSYGRSISKHFRTVSRSFIVSNGFLWKHYNSVIIMRPSSLGGAAYCVALCLSVCLSVCPSVRPSRYQYRASRGAT